jgi:glycosyltransferase involved in cell wall biosynthesis
MKILLISSFLPYPLYSGGNIRLYNIIKELAKKHEITLVCEIRSYQTSEDVKEVKKFCKEVITVPRKKQWSIKNIFKTGFSSYPFLLIGHESHEMKSQIVRLLNEKHFDVIHVETFYVFHNLPKTYLPIVLVEHNIEYLVYSRYMYAAMLYLRPLLFFDIIKIKKWERFFWHKATKLVAVSKREKQEMGREDVAIVPNGVDITKFKMKSIPMKKEKRILFIGDFTWVQNRESIKWILKEIWPAILQEEKLKKEQLLLWVVGKNVPDTIKNLGTNSVFFDEHAPDETWKIYQKSYVLLAPITVGGGTSYKILEAMASGVPVITTNLGMEGLEAREQKEALMGITSEDFIKHIVHLIENKDLYTTITKNARTLVEEKYTWPNIVKKLEAVYTSAIHEKQN